jgi:hypothetical protein
MARRTIGRRVAVDTTTLAVSAITLVAGAVVSGVGTYLVARRTLAYEYDSDLRKRRIEAYTDLWRRLEPLAKDARTEEFTKADAEDFATCLRVWYFETGGLFLSKATRTDYFALQDLLVRLDGGWGWDEEDPETLADAAREYLRVCGSRLRTGLTQDVGTRTRPKVRGNLEHIDHTFRGTYRRHDGYALELGVRPGLWRVPPGITLVAIAPDGARRSCLKRWEPARWTIRAELDDGEGTRRERVLRIERGELVEGPALEEDRTPAAVWKKEAPRLSGR